MKIALSTHGYKCPAVMAVLRTCDRIYTHDTLHLEQFQAIFGREKVLPQPFPDCNTVIQLIADQVAGDMKVGEKIEWVKFADLDRVQEDYYSTRNSTDRSDIADAERFRYLLSLAVVDGDATTRGETIIAIAPPGMSMRRHIDRMMRDGTSRPPPVFRASSKNLAATLPPSC